MRNKYGLGDAYQTPPRPHSGIATAAPGLYFYSRLLAGPLRWLCARAAKNQCDDIAWSNSSCWFADILEDTGCTMDISGMLEIDAVDGPCVFVANHMSTLETFVLPGIIRPRRPVTFVVKESLTTMPFFGPVMRSRNPVVVGRANPREDLAAVLEGGTERLQKGISIIVFPQSTRSLYFSSEHFNSIGVKLARRAKVPVIPLALKTDAWGQGKKIKEAGKIRPDLPVRFKFSKALQISGNGREEHAEICRFIEGTLSHWQKEDGINQ